MTSVLTTVAALRAACNDARALGLSVGVVPTMGYLHEGHRSLMHTARSECDFVVVTIFVNPLQFGPNEDLESYPRDLEADLSACEAEGVDVVFTPQVRDLYPIFPPSTTVHVAGLTDALCGASRPGHFDGVTTIVAKLFAVVGPSNAYFGRKDAQQLAVVRRMTTELELPVNVVGCPLVREPDGLAKSSRNAYLTVAERQAAVAISRALRQGVEAVELGMRDAAQVRACVEGAIAVEPALRIDYVAVCDAASIAAIDELDGSVLIAVAVVCGTTRLIDNATLTITGAHVVADLGTGWVFES